MFEHFFRDYFSALLLPLFIVTILGTIAGAPASNAMESLGGVVRVSVTLLFGAALKLLEAVIQVTPLLISAARPVLIACVKGACALGLLIADWVRLQRRKAVKSECDKDRTS